MLSKDKKQILDQIISSFSKEEIAWSSGYLSGFLADGTSQNTASVAIKDLTILYITETGNAKFLAMEIAKKLKELGAKTKVKSVEQYRLNDFAKEKNLVLISSTHGEGEIPLAGEKFYAHINENNLDLSKLNFLVIALGDRNYPLFCEAGKLIETRLEALKAKKLADRIDLDLDFENYIPQIISQIGAVFGEGEKAEIKPISTTSAQSNFIGTIATNVNLNDIGSDKETRHIEITLDDEIDYEPGDSIGILFGNDELKIEGKITPRLYSIASSKNEHGNEVHLTVSVVRYVDKDGKEVTGLFSGKLAELKEGSEIKFYISRNRQFKLPADDKDIIMVGPGTGVAPFRAFVAERNYRGSVGKSWLFFGERTFKDDFLYQTEWQDYLTSGALTKFDVAFSRDQKEKIYVQNKIKEKAKEVYEWLNNGAYFYICGDKENMAKDVENALLEVIEEQGNKNRKQATEYLNELVEQDRYLKDVY